MRYLQILEAAASSAPNPLENSRFRTWFGASKIVNADGEPMKCYHGTRAAAFDRFSHDHTSSTAMGRSSGFFFTANPTVATGYTDDDVAGTHVLPVYLRITNPLQLNRYTDTSQLVELLGPEVEQLNDVMSDTYGSRFRHVGRAQTYFFFKDEWGDHLIALAKRRGYDGVIFPETKTGRDQYDETIVAFSPNQIKSAISSQYSMDKDGLSEATR